MPDAYRKMWLLVFYDLPVVETEQRRQATKFHAGLVDQGFDRLHYSVYMRYCGSVEKLATAERAVQAIMPDEGNVVSMRLTDRQMANMKRWTNVKRGKPILPPAQYELL
jgi:CRISPR-associated protein Cas2